MDFKGFYDEIIFDVDRSILKSYTGKQGDTKSRGLYVTVTQKNAVIEDLTGLSMRFFYEKPDKTRGFIDGVVDGNKFRIDYTNQMYAVPGVVKAELRLMGADGEIITAKTFKILVDSSIADGSIVSENERGILDRAFELAEDIIPRLELLDVELLEDVQNEMLQSQLKVAKVEKELNDYKATMQQINIHQSPTQKASGHGIVSLPPNAAEGQISVTVRGRTLKQELVYDYGTMAEWSVIHSTTQKVAGGFIGTHNGTDSVSVLLSFSQVKPATKYGLLLCVSKNTSNAPFYFDPNGFLQSRTGINLGNTVGNKKLVFTTKENISSKNFQLFQYSQSSGEIAFQDIRLFELPAGSEIENDFNTLSADELAQKYPYISGGSAKSTISAGRIKIVGKNLFHPKYALKNRQYSIREYLGVQCLSWVASSNMQYGFFMDGMFEKGKQYMMIVDMAVASDKATLRWLYDDGTTQQTQHSQTVDSFTRIISTSAAGKNVVGIGGTWNASQRVYVRLDTFQIQKADASQEYEPYMESNTYFVTKDPETDEILQLRSLPNGTKDEINVTDRKLIKRIGEKSNIANGMVIDFADMAEGGTYYAWNDDGETEAGVKGDTLGIDATTLIYQLATPVEIPVQVSGTLVGYPSGTVYIEPYVADAGIYTDKMEVLYSDLPIKALEKISKVDFDTGLETELDITAAVIAEDKLSFTHPDLTSGDIVFFVYEHGAEGTIPETEISYYDSRYVIKGEDDKFYQWEIEAKLVEGVITPSIKLVEV